MSRQNSAGEETARDGVGDVVLCAVLGIVSRCDVFAVTTSRGVSKTKTTEKR
jgi:hypothetical protein